MNHPPVGQTKHGVTVQVVRHEDSEGVVFEGIVFDECAQAIACSLVDPSEEGAWWRCGDFVSRWKGGGL